MTKKLSLIFAALIFSSNAHAIYGMPDNFFEYLTQTKKIPALNLDKNSVTVSGISSGGFMAVQLGVAYSSQIKGVGVVAGGIYECSEGDINTAKELCMKDPAKINVNKTLEKVASYYQKNLIDNPKSIQQQHILLIQGTEDIVVNPAAGPVLEKFYKSLGATVSTDFNKQMGHGFPATHGSNTCQMSRSPWVNDCGHSGAGEILKSLYGTVSPPAKAKTGVLVTIDQSEFGSDNAKMLDYGYLYIPKKCVDGNTQCRLHVALHGCLQSPSAVGTAFVEGSQFNDWADTNNIVILYPAATTCAANPAGCWDWFGYTGKDFATKNAPQGQVIMKMIERLTSEN